MCSNYWHSISSHAFLYWSCCEHKKLRQHRVRPFHAHRLIYTRNDAIKALWISIVMLSYTNWGFCKTIKWWTSILPLTHVNNIQKVLFFWHFLIFMFTAIATSTVNWHSKSHFSFAGISILFLKPVKQPPDLFSFLSPLR